MCCVHRTFVVFLFLFFLSIMGSADAAQPIRIGVSIALSGRYAPMANMYADGLRLWEKDINAKGGVLGRPVRLLIYDDRSSSQKAREIYQRMLTEERVDFVLGPYSSTIGKEIAPIVEEHRFPTLLLSAADAIWAGRPRYVFGMHTSEQRWVSAILIFLARQGIDKIGILMDKTFVRMGMPKGLDKWARRLNQSVLMNETLNVRDVEKQVRQARDLGVQAVIHWGYIANAVRVREALDAVGWYPRVYFSQIGPSLSEYHRILGPLADYTVGTSVWEPSIAYCFPGGKQFVEQFRREYGRTPSYHAAMGFAAGEVLAGAIAAAGTIDRETVRKELSVLDMATVVGCYGVDTNGRQLRQRPLIIQWQDGKKKVLSPGSMCNGQLQYRPE